MEKENTETYNLICFRELVYEFDFSDKKEIEKKIKRKLKYHKVGEYDQEKIDYIRKLKNELHKEISSQSKSKYYNKTKSNYSDLNDFNIERMQLDYLEVYDRITKDEISEMLKYAIYLYHMR